MKTRLRLYSILVFFSLGIIIASLANAEIRIMPLGDSITRGSSSGEPDPGSSIPEREEMIENYNIVIEKTAGSLSRAWVPVNRLIPLPNEPVIQSITLPKRLITPRD